MHEKELFDYLIINDKMDEFLNIQEDDEDAEIPKNNENLNQKNPDSNDIDEQEKPNIGKEQERDLWIQI